jgi:ribosomal protein S18 acetylase RimI-like enzyme
MPNHMPSPEIRRCTTSEDFDQAMQVTRSYVDWLGVDLGYQDFDEEMATFSRMYGLPKGAYLLAYVETDLAGGVGGRDLGGGVCEMKRLFVYEAYQGMGIARDLCGELIQFARGEGYRSIRLDTLPNMKPAQALYKELGFNSIDAYRYNPDPGTVYMELAL